LLCEVHIKATLSAASWAVNGAAAPRPDGDSTTEQSDNALLAKVRENLGALEVLPRLTPDVLARIEEIF
jgi:hypothetical protein